jgi:DNA polymerase-1
MSGLTAFLMHDVEMPLIEVVADMEDAGYPIDVEFFRRLGNRLKKKIEKARAEIRRIAGTDFNPESGKQVAKLLYDKLGLEVIKRTAKGAPSTDNDTLEQLKEQHPVIPRIIQLRKLAKIASTYCKIPDDVGDDGRLHVSFNQLAAQTGRFSSSSVIQTLPKHDEYNLRRGFRATDGFRIVAADYEQQELNVLAQVSDDKELVKAIETGTDLHGLAAVKVFGLECEPNEVKQKHPEKRDQVKAIQFGLIYGRSAYSLAKSLGIDNDDAEKIIESYFKQFSAIQQYIKGVHEALMRDGYVDDVFGRRRHFPIVKKKAPRKRNDQLSKAEQELPREINKAKREAQNFVIQGPSATITKLAMIRCHKHIQTNYGSDVRMILQLHDELQFEVREDLVPEFAAELPGLMCDLGIERFGFQLPLTIEVKEGRSWGELKKWEGAE